MRAGKNNPLIFILATLLSLLLGACPTIPKGKTAGDWLGILPQHSSFYMYINHKTANPALKSILKKTGQLSSDLEAILDRTEKSYLGVLLKAKNAPQVSLVLLGGYPVLFINDALAKNKDFSKVEKPFKYYQNDKAGLQISLLRPYMILVANGNMEKMLTNYGEALLFPLARDIDLEMAAADILLFFPLGLENEVADNLQINWRKISIREIWLTAQAREDGFMFSGVFLIANETGARLFSTIFKLTLITLLRDIKIEGLSGRLKNVKIFIEDSKVKITNFFLSTDELADLVTGIIKQPGKTQ
jgi:hypothetical protein